jgi:hypothetical protein
MLEKGQKNGVSACGAVFLSFFFVRYGGFRKNGQEKRIRASGAVFLTFFALTERSLFVHR